MRGTAPIITCDADDGCDQWTVDYYSALASNWRELMPGWQYDPRRDDVPHLCPTHAPTRAGTTCLEPVWDGPYRSRCSMGTAGVCAKHGKHRPHPEDGRPCKPNRVDWFCHAHGLYMDPSASRPAATPRW